MVQSDYSVSSLSEKKSRERELDNYYGIFRVEKVANVSLLTLSIVAVGSDLVLV